VLTNLKLRNFKCFGDANITLNNLTVLAGGNATGKSSIVQALLFLAYLAEHDKTDIDIRKIYDFNNLGVAKSLVSHNPTGDDDFIEIEVTVNNISTRVLMKTTPSPYTLKLATPMPSPLSSYVKYLKAERMGSRIITAISGSFDDLGYAGEYTPSVIDNADKKEIKIHEKISNESGKFSAQVEKWMSGIMGYMEIDITSDNAKGFTDTKFKNSVTDYGVIPPLTGFGITYVMPIVVAGLLCSAQPDSILIVENPEAHLHPMAQSNIGKFLAILAECGVQVIIETHSEHIIDGARIQLKKDNETDRMTINFFELQRKKIGIETINIKSTGELEYWPNGFFDQKKKDLRELLFQ